MPDPTVELKELDDDRNLRQLARINNYTWELTKRKRTNQLLTASLGTCQQ